MYPALEQLNRHPMTDFSSVPYSGNHLADLLALVSDNARARWPLIPYLLNSDVAWRLPGSGAEENIRLWYDEAGLAAYAAFIPFTHSTIDLRDDMSWGSPIAGDVLVWLEERQRSHPPMYPWLHELKSMVDWEQALIDGLPSRPCKDRIVQVECMDSDDERIRFMTDHGFNPTEHFDFKLSRDLEDLPAPDLPEGYTLRHVEPDDFDERVAVHRESWFKSSFNLEQYLVVRAIGEFDRELDIVAVAPDGKFASYCIGWVDYNLGVGSFEPVGTPPTFRRMGLAQQVNFEGLRRMKAKGMHSAKIGTAGFNDRACNLYKSCGFEVRDHARTYIKII
jgi:ribosomal protein S18 acetylase RimI-like enzyme